MADHLTVLLVKYQFIEYKYCYESFAELRWKYNSHVFGRGQKARGKFETGRIENFRGFTTFPVDYAKGFYIRGDISVGNS